MTALFTFLATAAGKWIVGALAVVVAVVGAWLKGRLSGAKAERAKQAERETAARDVRDQVQSDVGAMSADQIRSELAKRTRG